jgi:hypothetical protein
VQQPEQPPASGGQNSRRRDLTGRERASWLLTRYVPEVGVLNVPFAIRLTAGIEMSKLRAAVAVLVRRHPALRTLFPAVDGQPERVTLPAEDPRATVRIRRRLVAHNTLDTALTDAASTPIDPETDLPIRVGVLSSDVEDVVWVSVHHLVYDAHSAAVLERELVQAYGALVAGRELPPQLAGTVEPPEPYPATEASLAYWRAELRGATSTPDLAIGRPGARSPRFPGADVHRPFSPDAWDAVGRIARRASAVPSAVVLAAYATVLCRHGAGEDIVFGVPFYGRGAQPHDAVGYYVTIAPLRVRAGLEIPFDELVKQCARDLLAGLQHADAGVDDIAAGSYQSQDAGERPLIRYLFNFVADLPPEETEAAARLGAASYPVRPGHSRMDLDLIVSRADDGPRMHALYAADLFAAEEAAALLARVEAVVLAADEAPATVGSLPIWSADDLAGRPVADAADRPAAELPSVAQDIASTAFVAPATAAVLSTDGAGRLSYGELVASADATAADLAAAGILDGSLVRVAADDPADRAIGMLACWIARCAAVVGGSGPDGAALIPDGTGSPVPLRRVDGAGPVVLAEVPHPEDTAVRCTGADGSALDVSHRELAVSAHRIGELAGLTARDVVAVPGAALAATEVVDAVAAWCRGAAVLPLPAAGGEAAAAALRAGATVLAVPPLVCARLAEAGGIRTAADGEAGAAVRVLARGDRLTGESGSLAEHAGLTLVRVTQVGGVVVAGGPVPFPAHPGWAGEPLLGVPTTVLDGVGAPAPPGLRGTLRVGGPAPAELAEVSWSLRDGGLVAAQLDPDSLVEQRAESHAWVHRAVLVRDPRGPALVLDAGPSVDAGAVRADVADAAGLEGLRVVLGRLPLDADGLVDRAAAARAAEPVEAPDRQEVEDVGIDLVELWRTLLKDPGLGPDDNFFTRGGDSLLAAQMISRIAKQTGLRVSLRSMFAAPTPAALARQLAAARARQVSEPAPARAG